MPPWTSRKSRRVRTVPRLLFETRLKFCLEAQELYRACKGKGLPCRMALLPAVQVLSSDSEEDDFASAAGMPVAAKIPFGPRRNFWTGAQAADLFFFLVRDKLPPHYCFCVGSPAENVRRIASARRKGHLVAMICVPETEAHMFCFLLSDDSLRVFDTQHDGRIGYLRRALRAVPLLSDRRLREQRMLGPQTGAPCCGPLSAIVLAANCLRNLGADAEAEDDALRWMDAMLTLHWR